MLRWSLSLVALCSTLAAAAGQSWTDPFDGAALDRRWAWRTPVAGPTWSLQARPGWLRLTLPSRDDGFNHWNEPVPVDEAPQLRAPAPGGDWDLEARIQLQQWSPAGSFQIGLVVGESDAQLLSFGPMQAPGLPDGPTAPEVWLEPTGTSAYARVPGDGKDVVLRLAKRGQLVQAFLRRDEGRWIDGGAYPLAEDPKFVGLIAKSFSADAAVVADVDYVRLEAFAPGTAPLLSAASPRPELAALSQRAPGFVVWESNRGGQWELYRMGTDGTGFRQITHLGRPGDPSAYKGFLQPRVSPDGQHILFSYGRKGVPIQTWVVPSGGGPARKLCDGHPLNWSADGKYILFVRNRQLWRYEFPTGAESLVSPVQLPEIDRSMVGSARDDLKAVEISTPQGNEYFVLDQGKTVKTMGGCQPRLTADGRYAYWVQSPKDFRVWDIAADKEWQILGEPPGQPHNYTYFPTITPDNRWLVYGASPNQHDHDTSDYEIFVIELRDLKAVGEPVRLTWHPKTDRWPFLWVAH